MRNLKLLEFKMLVKHHFARCFIDLQLTEKLFQNKNDKIY